MIISGYDLDELYDRFVVEVYRDDVWVENVVSLPTALNDTSFFEFEVSIPAERANYDLNCYGIEGTNWKLIRKANDIVSGDIYTINGQSNAIASSLMSDADVDPFLRGVDWRGEWNNLRFSFPGVWGGRMAKKILDEHNVPVALFNYAEGGKALEYFMPEYDDVNPNNYKSLLDTLNHYQLKGKVRGMIWFQGEADGWDQNLQDYQSEFLRLTDLWQSEYLIDHVFLFQVRPYSCNGPRPFVIQAQRQAALIRDNIDIMSTSNAIQVDSCHFDINSSYLDLGDRMYALVANRLYGNNNLNAFAPDIIKANRFQSNQLILEFGPMFDNLEIIGTPWYDFTLNDPNIYIINGEVEDRKLILTLSEDLPTDTVQISYTCHVGAANDWVTNETGIGILSFLDFPVAAQDSFITTNINELGAITFSFYPNPTENVVHFDFGHYHDVSEDEQLRIIDCLGTVVFEKPMKELAAVENISLDHLPVGTYFVCVVGEKQQGSIQKLILY